MPSAKLSLRKLIFGSLTLSLCFVSTAFAQDPQSEEKPQPPKIIRKSGGVLQGSATRRVEPAYPPLAKAAQVSGPVVVEVTIDEEGDVISARAISGHPLLKDAALTAAKGWKFSPTALQGVPVKVIGTITFNFSLDHSKEIEVVKQELASTPSSAELHYKLGSLYIEERKYEDAIGAFTDAIGLAPRFAKAYVGLGDAHMRSYTRADRFASAIDAYTRAVSIDPDYAEAYCSLGLAYILSQRFAEAIEAFTNAARVNPNMEEAYDGLARAYSITNRDDAALEAFKEVVRIRPGNADAHLSIGVLYIKLGDKESAMREYTSLKEISPSLAERLLERIKNDNQ